MKPFFSSKDGYFQLFKGDCIDILCQLWNETVTVNMIFADPPYFLSNSGITCNSGKAVSVNKGTWDRSNGLLSDHNFNIKWLRAAQNILNPNGSIWVSGTKHNIYSVGFALQELGFKILNNITWQKSSPPPNLSCKYFTHSTENIIWAAKNQHSKHIFNYSLMKKENNNKQMKDVWIFSSPKKSEKTQGKHPAQKPEALLNRIIKASTNQGDLILDPFNGSATSGIVGYKLKRRYIGIEQDEKYLELSIKRFKSEFKE